MQLNAPMQPRTQHHAQPKKKKVGACTSDALRPKRVILFLDVMSLMSAVMSYVTSWHCTCIGHVTFYYKRSDDASVGGSRLLVYLFIRFTFITRDPRVAGA